MASGLVPKTSITFFTAFLPVSQPVCAIVQKCVRIAVLPLRRILFYSVPKASSMTPIYS